MIKSLALARLKSPQTKAKTQTVALTDMKGAAKVIQKIFDKYKLGLKVTPIPATIHDGYDDREASMDVDGKTPFGLLKFTIYLSEDEKDIAFHQGIPQRVRLEPVLELIDFAEGNNGLSGSPKADADILKHYVSGFKSAAKKACDNIKRTELWWTQFESAVKDIQAVTRANRK